MPILGSRTSRTFTAVVSCVLLAYVPPVGCRRESHDTKPQPPLVTVAQASVDDAPVYIDEIGTCTAREAVAIRPQVSGQITAIHFSDGADMKQGDMLFTIDPRPYQAALDQAKAGLLQNEASLALAESEFQRARVLLPTKAISKEEFETRQSTVDVYKAMVQAGKASIEAAQVNLDYCFIHSPVDGRAGKRQVDMGNVVAANSGTVLVSILRLDPIYADFTIAEPELDGLRRKMAEGTLKTSVRLPEEPESNARVGDLTFMDNTVQTGTGTILLRATLANADHHFWPGQFVRIRLVLSTLKEAVLIPYQATQISQNGPYVFVVGPDSTAQFRLVKLGLRQGEQVVVLSGVRGGEKVIATGQLTVTPGGKVQVEQAAQSLPSTASASSTQGRR